MIIPAVVQQHADDAALLASNRLALAQAPYARLDHIDAFDRRLMAHLDGLRLAGEEGWALCESGLESPSSGVVFAIGVRTLEDRDETKLARIIAVVQAVPETAIGLLAAFEWTERARLQGTVAGLLRDGDGFRRMVGVAACSAHRVDPGLGSGGFLRDADPRVRACSFRAAGELGVSEAGPSCVSALTDTDDECRFWAAWSATLLGDRNRALDALREHGLSVGRHRARAFRLALQAMGPEDSHEVLQKLAGSKRVRGVIEGSGIAGDPAYVPWLVKQMKELGTARLAGEAFATITGINLGQAALDRPAPENFESGPNDDPDDPNVDMDPDEGLPWPDADKIEKWWEANGSRFQKGTRYFVGTPVTREHCIDVLKNGYQRHRILAAHYLCLLQPGTPLFNTSAPAWRQQRRVMRMM